MRAFRPNTIPDKAHPLVRRLYQEMNKQQIGVLDMSERSGVNKNTFKDWRTRTMPRVADLEACFNVLGLTLTLKRYKDQSELEEKS
jgi:hypothetical protein